jgi:carboxyl-terminal processing protease
MKKTVSIALLAAFASLAVAVPLLARQPSKPVPINDLTLIDGVMQIVEKGYVHPVSSRTLTVAALKGMLERLDPHSDYMDEAQFQKTKAEIAGRFGGIGIEITQEKGVPKVVSPIDGTPAAEAGIEPGDLIVAVDKRSTQRVALDRIVDTLRGPPGSKVTLTILRGEEAPFDVTLTRRIIQVKSVKAKLEQGDIGYVRVSQFADETAKDFRDAVNRMKSEAGGHLQGLVIDLRDDPGGLLQAAIDVAGDLVDGRTIVTTRGRNQKDTQVFKAAARGDLVPHTPVVVLINSASASASEIVAGALKDLHRATIMGTRSFGKGSVQTLIPLDGHGALRLTTALYYTPSGRSIQGQGIEPDIVVEAPQNEQVANALVTRENELPGALQNGGSLGGAAGNESGVGTAGKGEDSPPIKASLIGTPQDSQLKAAIAFLQQHTTTGSGR